MTNYPVGDFLIQIKNAAMARNREVSVPETKLVKTVANVLKKQGLLDEIRKDKNNITVRLAYKKKEPVLLGLKLISKPGLRVYWDVDQLEKTKGPSMFLISTSVGILSSKDAIKKRVGGEVIVEIW